jgi:DDE superfamily endonuclease
MESNPTGATAAPDPPLVPPILATWLLVFRPCFTAPVWERVLVLVAGAVLAPGKRTVTQALRVMGLADGGGFRRYHEVLSRARWNARAVARQLLLPIIARLLPDGDVVIGIDDTIERRWGARIKARGIYRDPVRSSKGHFVKTSGLRWLSLMVSVPIPWSGRTWSLPFLTILAPSARWSEANGRRHKTLTSWAKLAKVPPAQPVECQMRGVRRSCKPNGGCPIAVLSSSATMVLPRLICSPPSAPMFAWSPGCGWMPACSGQHPSADRAGGDALR